MNTCCAPHLGMRPERSFTMTSIALFSASEQTNCALVVCDCMNDCMSLFVYMPDRWFCYRCNETNTGAGVNIQYQGKSEETISLAACLYSISFKAEAKTIKTGAAH